MEKSEMFEIEYKGRKLNIPKESVEFQFGYSVVKKTIKSSYKDYGFWRDYDLELTGVINENYDTVIEFAGHYEKIEIFPEGNFIVEKRFSRGDGEQAHTYCEIYLYKLEGDELKESENLSFSDYDLVNEKTIKVKRSINFFEKIVSLVDVTTMKVISEEFSTIGNFEQSKEDSVERLAEATLVIPYSDSSNNVCKVVCYIDESGKIRTPLFCSHSAEYIETSSEDFDFKKEVKKIKKELKLETERKSELFNGLKKTITTQKSN